MENGALDNGNKPAVCWFFCGILFICPGFWFRPDLHLVIQGSGQGIGVTGYGGVGVDDLSIGT